MKLSLLLLFLPFVSLSQEVVGLWSKVDSKQKIGLEYKSDGSFNLVDLTNPQNKILRNLTITYVLTVKNDDKYIEQSYYQNNKLLKTELLMYKIVNDILYLPLKTEENGEMVIRNFEDKYIRIK